MTPLGSSSQSAAAQGELQSSFARPGITALRGAASVAPGGAPTRTVPRVHGQRAPQSLHHRLLKLSHAEGMERFVVRARNVRNDDGDAAELSELCKVLVESSRLPRDPTNPDIEQIRDEHKAHLCRILASTVFCDAADTHVAQHAFDCLIEGLSSIQSEALLQFAFTYMPLHRWYESGKIPVKQLAKLLSFIKLHHARLDGSLIASTIEEVASVMPLQGSRLSKEEEALLSDLIPCLSHCEPDGNDVRRAATALLKPAEQASSTDIRERLIAAIVERTQLPPAPMPESAGMP